jgi:hypothetical protein
MAAPLQNIKMPDRKSQFYSGKILLILEGEAWLNLFWEYINGKLFAVW